MLDEEACRTSAVVTGLWAARARFDETVGRAGTRAEDVNRALNTLFTGDDRATETLELERALKTERAAV